MRRRSSGGTGTASLEPEDNQGIDLSKVEIPEGEVAMYNNLQRKEGEKEKVHREPVKISHRVGGPLGGVCWTIFNFFHCRNPNLTST